MFHEKIDRAVEFFKIVAFRFKREFPLMKDLSLAAQVAEIFDALDHPFGIDGCRTPERIIVKK